ncbi:hypothetical protein [Microcystis phage Mel-JY01]
MKAEAQRRLDVLEHETNQIEQRLLEIKERINGYPTTGKISSKEWDNEIVRIIGNKFPGAYVTRDENTGRMTITTDTDNRSHIAIQFDKKYIMIYFLAWWQGSIFPEHTHIKTTLISVIDKNLARPNFGEFEKEIQFAYDKLQSLPTTKVTNSVIGH